MKYWVFDLDGTLIDSHGAYFKSLQHVLEQFGSELTEFDQKEILRISVKNRADFFNRKLGHDHAKQAMAALDRRLQEDYLRVSVYDGMIPLLQTLKSRNLELAVWTARDLSSAEQVLKHLKIYSYFSLCVGSSCLSQCKPHPEGLLKVASYFQCSPIEMAMVGDHENDLLAAKACGARAIQAMWHNPQGVVRSHHADEGFHDVQVFKGWLSRNLSAEYLETIAPLNERKIGDS